MFTKGFIWLINEKNKTNSKTLEGTRGELRFRVLTSKLLTLFTQYKHCTSYASVANVGLQIVLRVQK